MDFFAHSGKMTDRSDWQALSVHLKQVASLAADRLRAANCSDLASLSYLAGLLHDLGKYRPEFQKMIRGMSPPREKTYHKQAGAAKAAAELKCFPVAFAIAGHHGGLPNKTELESAVLSPRGLAVAREVWNDAVGDFPELAICLLLRTTCLDEFVEDSKCQQRFAFEWWFKSIQTQQLYCRPTLRCCTNDRDSLDLKMMSPTHDARRAATLAFKSRTTCSNFSKVRNSACSRSFNLPSRLPCNNSSSRAWLDAGNLNWRILLASEPSAKTSTKSSKTVLSLAGISCVPPFLPNHSTMTVGACQQQPVCRNPVLNHE